MSKCDVVNNFSSCHVQFRSDCTALEVSAQCRKGLRDLGIGVVLGV